MLIARIQQLTGAAGYLRGKQDPIEESAEEEKSEDSESQAAAPTNKPRKVNKK